MCVCEMHWVIRRGRYKYVTGARTRTHPFPPPPHPQRQAFAMNVSGFHFDVTVTDMAAYDFVGGALEVGGIILLLLLFLIDKLD